MSATFSFLRSSPALSSPHLPSPSLSSPLLGDGRGEKVIPDALFDCDSAPHLRYLLLGHSTLATVQGVSELRHLWYLDISGTRVENLMGFEVLTVLGHLDIRNTMIPYKALKLACQRLHIMNMRTQGSVASAEASRRRMIAGLPRLWALDDVFITTAEAHLACEVFPSERQSAHRAVSSYGSGMDAAWAEADWKPSPTSHSFVTELPETPVRRPRQSLLDAKGEWRRLDSIALGPECADFLDVIGAEPADIRLRDAYRLRYMTEAYIRDSAILSKAYSLPVATKGLVLRKVDGPEDDVLNRFPSLHLSLLLDMEESLLADLMCVLTCYLMFPKILEESEEQPRRVVAATQAIPHAVVHAALLNALMQHITVVAAQQPGIEHSAAPAPVTPSLVRSLSKKFTKANIFLAAPGAAHTGDTSEPARDIDIAAPLEIVSEEAAGAAAVNAIIDPDDFLVLDNVATDLSSLPSYAIHGWLYIAVQIARLRGICTTNQAPDLTRSTSSVIVVPDERQFVRRMMQLESKGHPKRVDIGAMRSKYAARSMSSGRLHTEPESGASNATWLRSAPSLHRLTSIKSLSTMPSISPGSTVDAGVHTASGGALHRSMSSKLLSASGTPCSSRALLNVPSFRALPSTAGGGSQRGHLKHQPSLWNSLPPGDVFEHCGSNLKFLLHEHTWRLLKRGATLCAGTSVAQPAFISLRTFAGITQFLASLRGATTVYRLQRLQLSAALHLQDAVADAFPDPCDLTDAIRSLSHDAYGLTISSDKRNSNSFSMTNEDYCNVIRYRHLILACAHADKPPPQHQNTATAMTSTVPEEGCTSEEDSEDDESVVLIDDAGDVMNNNSCAVLPSRDGPAGQQHPSTQMATPTRNQRVPRRMPPIYNASPSRAQHARGATRVAVVSPTVVLSPSVSQADSKLAQRLRENIARIADIRSDMKSLHHKYALSLRKKLLNQADRTQQVAKLRDSERNRVVKAPPSPLLAPLPKNKALQGSVSAPSLSHPGSHIAASKSPDHRLIQQDVALSRDNRRINVNAASAAARDTRLALPILGSAYVDPTCLATLLGTDEDDDNEEDDDSADNGVDDDNYYGNYGVDAGGGEEVADYDILADTQTRDLLMSIASTHTFDA